MKPKRIYQVYQEAGREKSILEVTSLSSRSRQYAVCDAQPGQWRFRIVAARNKQTVGGSQEAFDSKGNAMRAAKREVSLYLAGVAVVEVAE